MYNHVKVSPTLVTPINVFFLLLFVLFSKIAILKKNKIWSEQITYVFSSWHWVSTDPNASDQQTAQNIYFFFFLLRPAQPAVDQFIKVFIKLWNLMMQKENQIVFHGSYQEIHLHSDPFLQCNSSQLQRLHLKLNIAVNCHLMLFSHTRKLDVQTGHAKSAI